MSKEQGGGRHGKDHYIAHEWFNKSVKEEGTTNQDATTTASYSTVGPETLTTLTAWGENFFGQLGNVTPLPYGSHSNTPVEVSDLEGAEVKAISGGQLHSLA